MNQCSLVDFCYINKNKVLEISRKKKKALQNFHTAIKIEMYWTKTVAKKYRGQSKCQIMFE